MTDRPIVAVNHPPTPTHSRFTIRPLTIFLLFILLICSSISPVASEIDPDLADFEPLTPEQEAALFEESDHRETAAATAHATATRHPHGGAVSPTVTAATTQPTTVPPTAQPTPPSQPSHAPSKRPPSVGFGSSSVSLAFLSRILHDLFIRSEVLDAVQGSGSAGPSGLWGGGDGGSAEVFLQMKMDRSKADQLRQLLLTRTTPLNAAQRKRLQRTASGQYEDEIDPFAPTLSLHEEDLPEIEESVAAAFASIQVDLEAPRLLTWAKMARQEEEEEEFEEVLNAAENAAKNGATTGSQQSTRRFRRRSSPYWRQLSKWLSRFGLLPQSGEEVDTAWMVLVGLIGCMATLGIGFSVGRRSKHATMVSAVVAGVDSASGLVDGEGGGGVDEYGRPRRLSSSHRTRRRLWVWCIWFLILSFLGGWIHEMIEMSSELRAEKSAALAKPMPRHCFMSAEQREEERWASGASTAYLIWHDLKSIARDTRDYMFRPHAKGSAETEACVRDRLARMQSTLPNPWMAFVQVVTKSILDPIQMAGTAFGAASANFLAQHSVMSQLVVLGFLGFILVAWGMLAIAGGMGPAGLARILCCCCGRGRRRSSSKVVSRNQSSISIRDETDEEVERALRKRLMLRQLKERAHAASKRDKDQLRYGRSSSSSSSSSRRHARREPLMLLSPSPSESSLGTVSDSEWAPSQQPSRTPSPSPPVSPSVTASETEFEEVQMSSPTRMNRNRAPNSSTKRRDRDRDRDRDHHKRRSPSPMDSRSPSPSPTPERLARKSSAYRREEEQERERDRERERNLKNRDRDRDRDRGRSHHDRGHPSYDPDTVDEDHGYDDHEEERQSRTPVRSPKLKPTGPPSSTRQPRNSPPPSASSKNDRISNDSSSSSSITPSKRPTAEAASQSSANSSQQASAPTSSPNKRSNDNSSSSSSNSAEKQPTPDRPLDDSKEDGGIKAGGSSSSVEGKLRANRTL